MPELPEVETVKNTLKQLVIGKTITDITVYWPNIIKKPDDIQDFADILHGQTIHNIRRKGKFIIFDLDSHVLVSHLRMEGKYYVRLEDEPLNKHTHVLFTFADGWQLRYQDVRKFGTLHVFPKGEEDQVPPLSNLGPDPFDEICTHSYLAKRFARTTRPIKNVLLDQTIMAGLGNIYVDETLFKAGIHPLQTANTLTINEIKTVLTAACDILTYAIACGGTTIRSYVDSNGNTGQFQQELLVYGRTGEHCRECQTVIEKIKVSGRGTHFCPTCQGERN